MQVQFGIDNFLKSPPGYKRVPIALVTNNAATTSAGVPTRIALVKNGFNLRKLFSPEHGISATGADGTLQDNAIDPVTGLPVISLYGHRISPSDEDLADIDICIFDIPDAGSRFYTYLWTMTYVMEACAKFNKSFLVLDRPNPIGADLSKAEGPMLDEENCSSFIGRWSIPVKHGCTLGELALYFAAVKIKDLELKIIQAGNYDRKSTTNNFLFIPPSPAIEDPATAMLYPGIGLLEGVNVNEGRGTGKPFRICGAPWINSYELQGALLEKHLPGVTIIPAVYKAAATPYKDETCYGIELQVTDADKFCSVNTGIELLRSIQQLYPLQFKERLYTTHVNPTGRFHLDKLLGVQNAFVKLQRGNAFEIEVANQWKTEMNSFLLY